MGAGIVSSRYILTKCKTKFSKRKESVSKVSFWASGLSVTLIASHVKYQMPCNTKISLSVTVCDGRPGPGRKRTG